MNTIPCNLKTMEIEGTEDGEKCDSRRQEYSDTLSINQPYQLRFI